MDNDLLGLRMPSPDLVIDPLQHVVKVKSFSFVPFPNLRVVMHVDQVRILVDIASVVVNSCNPRLSFCWESDPELLHYSLSRDDSFRAFYAKTCSVG